MGSGRSLHRDRSTSVMRFLAQFTAREHPLSQTFHSAVRLQRGPSHTPFQLALSSLESQGKRSRLPNGPPLCRGLMHFKNTTTGRHDQRE